jgi:hypothetical protein
VEKQLGNVWHGTKCAHGMDVLPKGFQFLRFRRRQIIRPLDFL